MEITGLQLFSHPIKQAIQIRVWGQGIQHGRFWDIKRTYWLDTMIAVLEKFEVIVKSITVYGKRAPYSIEIGSCNTLLWVSHYDIGLVEIEIPS